MFFLNLNSWDQYSFLLQMQNNNQLPFLKYPLFVCAPMVDQSELPFRLLTRRHGANLCYTPMLHSKMMTTAKNYKQQHFTTCAEDRPLVAQLCGNDPQTMVKAAKMIENQVDAIDINLGCPQGIAKKGHYGSYLLEEPELIQKIVKALTQNIKVPIFCKIRILKSQEKTLQLADRICKAGCKLLTVHGRTKQQNKDRVGSCNWQMIKKIKQTVNIPVIANGGIYRFDDVSKCLIQTNVDGVMSSEALLQNPALFSNQILCLDTLALEYLQLAEKYPGASDSCVRAHMFKIMSTGLALNQDLRQRLVKTQGINNFRDIVQQMRVRRAGVQPEVKFGWYLRYWKGKSPQLYSKGIHIDQKPLDQIKQQDIIEQQEMTKKQQVMETAPINM